MNATASGPPVEVIPPLPTALTWRVLLIGAAVCAVVGIAGIGIDVAAVAGQSPEMVERLKWTEPRQGYERGSPGERARLMADIGRATPLPTVRIGLVVAGLVVGVGGLWLRYTDYRAWLVAAVAGGFAGFGLPLHWDSMRLVVWVAAAGAAVGGGLTALTPKWRYSLLSVGVLYHFLGTLTSSTLPETYGKPGPWVSSQAAGRVYYEYKQFAYLTNAYHFYSPDPGPASKFTLLIEYQIDDPDRPTRTTAEWVELPRRRENYKDPLGLTYYRRLSITELASSATPGNVLPPSWEKGAVMQARQANEVGATKGVVVPGATTSFTEMDLSQYRLPSPGIRHAVYPSYARHIAAEYSGMRPVIEADGKPGREMYHRVTKVKMFRVEHRVVEPHQFLSYRNPDDVRASERYPGTKVNTFAGGDPYHPATYSPFYLGEYAADGTLLDPNDPLLYWHLPVRSPPADADTNPNAAKWDWMSEYAGRKFVWRGRE